MDFISILSIFVLACFIGYYVVWSVTPALHTPLMAVTNAISSVIIVGALIASAAGISKAAIAVSSTSIAVNRLVAPKGSANATPIVAEPTDSDAAKTKALARRAGVPTDTILRDLAKFEREAEAKGALESLPHEHSYDDYLAAQDEQKPLTGALINAKPDVISISFARGFSKWLGLLAVVLASVNIFGGFAVTARMLAMYKKKDRAPAKEPARG